MTKEELIQARDLVKEQHDNLSNPNWIASELHHLRGKYDQLTELINKEESNAPDPEKQQTNSNNS